MSKTNDVTVERLRDADCSKLTDVETRSAQCNALELFAECLPYTASNGVRFYPGAFNISTSFGSVVVDNGYYGSTGDGRDYYLMLKHRLLDSSDSRYVSCARVERVGTDALEALSVEIEKTIDRFKKFAMGSRCLKT